MTPRPPLITSDLGLFRRVGYSLAVFLRNSIRYLALVFVSVATWIPGGAIAQEPFVNAASEADFPLFQRSEPFQLAGNIAGLDYDDDDDIDIVFTMGDRDVELYRNDSSSGEAHFDHQSDAAGLVSTLDSVPGTPSEFAATGFAVGDFDNDGLEDLFLCRTGVNRLLLNRGGSFDDVTGTHLDGANTASRSAAAADFDGDGDLDIFVGNYVARPFFPYHLNDGDELLVNDGAGRFANLASAYGVDNRGATLAVAWADIDRDGDLDLFAINDFGTFDTPSRLYRNDGPAEDGWRFTDMTDEWHFGPSVYGMGVAFLDPDRDGDLDVIQTSIGRHAFHRWDAPGFTDATATWGLENDFADTGFRIGWALAAFDVTGDGYDELWIRSGELLAMEYLKNSPDQQDAVWRFGEGPEAVELLSPTAPSTSSQGRGLLVADLTLDGRQDVVGGSSGRPATLQIHGGSARPARIELVSSVSAPGAPGARLTTSCADHTIVRQSFAGGTFGSSRGSNFVWVGIPPECDSADVAIWWPSGVHQLIEAVTPGEMRAAHEPEWLRLSTQDVTAGSDEVVSLTIEPRAEEGALLGAGHNVQVTVDGDTQNATDDGGGLYTAEIPAPTDPGELRLDIAIDDVTQPAHPRVKVHPLVAAELRLFPATPVEGAESQVFINVGSGSAGLTLAGSPVESVEADGDGLGTATIVAPASELRLQATRNGDAIGDVLEIPVNPPVEDSFSEVWLRYPIPGQLTINAFLRDANRAPFEEASAIRIMHGDTPHEATMSADRVGFFSVDILVDEEDDGQRLHVEVAGQQIGASFEVRAWADNDDVAAAIDSGTSQIGPSQAGCYADGQDLIAIVALLADADGHLLPEVTGLQFDVTGAEVVEQSSHSRGRYTLILRCGLDAGVGRIELTYDDLPLGVATEFVLRPPRTVVLAPAETALELTEGLIPSGEPAEGLIMPFDEHRNAAGSVVTVELRPLDNSQRWTAEYCQVGAFCVEIPAPEGGGVLDLRVWLNGEPTSVTGQVSFETPHSDEPVDGSDAEVAADADAGDVASDELDSIGSDGDSSDSDGDSTDSDRSDTVDDLFSEAEFDSPDTARDSDPDPHSDINRDPDTVDGQPDERAGPPDPDFTSTDDGAETEQDSPSGEPPPGDVEEETRPVDNGSAPHAPSSGCNCSLGRTANGTPTACFALIILAAGVRRRRRRDTALDDACQTSRPQPIMGQE